MIEPRICEGSRCSSPATYELKWAGSCSRVYVCDSHLPSSPEVVACFSEIVRIPPPQTDPDVEDGA
jgi:hypothetical protein